MQKNIRIDASFEAKRISVTDTFIDTDRLTYKINLGYHLCQSAQEYHDLGEIAARQIPWRVWVNE